MNAPLEFLLVDDDDNKRSLISLFVLRRFPTAHVSEYTTGAGAIEHLKDNAVDAIITDHSMAPVNGIQLIRWVRKRFQTLPILMVTGHPEIESEAMDAGATLVLNFSRFAEVADVLARLLEDKPLQARC
jgi:CheY-like chemotaxis protein